MTSLRNVSLVIFGLLLAIPCQSDSPEQSFSVLGLPGVHLRENPTIGSQVIDMIPFGTMVKTDEEGKADEIGGVRDFWYAITYQGHSGYVWGEYLNDTLHVVNDTDYNHKFRLLLEGGHCAHVNYSPQLNWYGLFPTAEINRQELRRVDISLVFPKIMRPKQKEAFLESKPNFSEYFNPGIDAFIVMVAGKKRPFLLIGSKEPLTEGEINGRILADIEPYAFGPDNEQFLYPEQIKTFGLPQGRQLSVHAFEAAFVSDIEKKTIKKAYQWEVLNQPENLVWDKNCKRQNITDDIPYVTGTALLHSYYKTPTVAWYGDMDQDGEVDLLVYSSELASHGGAGWCRSLFLSSEKELGNFIKKVAEFKIGGCFG